MKHEFTCPECHLNFALTAAQVLNPNFCPFCKAPLHPHLETTDRETTRHHDTITGQGSTASATLVPGHTPEEEQIQFAIGPYQILKSIGKGGMGEVLLAYDTQCGRRIALKRIRTDLQDHPQLHNRFLKEARVTSQLTHPAIIPIYTIHSEKELVYYTMPFVEGDTLKQLLRNAQQKQKKGSRSENNNVGAIPALVRIFLAVCQAVAYAHSKGVLHRDLKPENVIVGRYGQVLILDWGLAKLTMHPPETAEDELPVQKPHNPLHELTRMGKIVGTVSYMAPERALGQPATFQTDIYSLGVTLYQILTLKSPFRRGTLQEYRKNFHKEVLLDPAEVAPYRDVPKVLSRICLKCLSPNPAERYHTVDEMIHDLENYIEGRSEWFQIAKLDVHNKNDWEFQENVLIAEHMAITRGTDVSTWVNLMISKTSFQENTKIEARVRIGEKGNGIGFLLSVPEFAERQQLNSGYCLWLGSDLDKSTKLLRATVEVLYAPEIYLQRNEWYTVKIEKVDNNIYFYLNGVLQFSYISHLPLIGTHVGLLARDADFTIDSLNVFIGSLSIKVNCLAVPDAFLAHKDYDMALSEYRRIGYSFPGTAEGREALFRAGITLLEQARGSSDQKEKTRLFELALEEFGKLHGNPGAPLEYLGKALVYKIMKDYEEEIKCFELAYRRYPQHPLVPVLQEQLVYRMHESSHAHRKATYHFVYLAVRHLSMGITSNHTKKLFTSLKKHWETLPFIEEVPESSDWSDKAYCLNFATQLAFWLALPYALEEIIEAGCQYSPPSSIVIGNALFCLVELGAWETARTHLQRIREEYLHDEIQSMLQLIDIAIQCHTSFSEGLQQLKALLGTGTLNKQTARLVYQYMEEALKQNKTDIVHDLAERTVGMETDPDTALQIRCYRIWAYLQEHNWEVAGGILHSYPLEQLSQEATLLHYLYGCWLYATEGKEIATIHFASVLDVAFPRSWNLLSLLFAHDPDRLNNWLKQAFLWEKRQLYRQCILFYQCNGDEAQVAHYRKLEQEEYTNGNS